MKPPSDPSSMPPSTRRTSSSTGTNDDARQTDGLRERGPRARTNDPEGPQEEADRQQRAEPPLQQPLRDEGPP